jgi:thiol-disulfide isomerase/thioredoxin
MKFNKYLFFFLTISQLSFGQKGINFINTSNFNVALNAAKQQNKLLFVEAYAPDCHVCMSFKGTFAQPQVGNVYNKNFINFQLDVNNPDNLAILKRYKIIINATPTFIFFDPKTMKVVQVKAFGEKDNSVISVNLIGQKAANPQEQVGNFPAKYNAGDRNPAFLLNYAQYARIMGDTMTNIKMMQEFAKVLPSNQYVTQGTLNILQTVLMNHDNELFDYFITHLPEYNKVFDPNMVRMIYENIFQIVLTSQINNLNSKSINKIKSQMKISGMDPGGIIRRTWLAESNLFFKQKNPAAGIKVIQNLINVLPNAPGPKEYQYLCDYVKSKTKDKKALKYAQVNWCKFGLR